MDPTPLTLLHVDEHVVVVAKPSGLAVHRGWSNDGVPLLQRLRDQLGRYVYPVHRIDRAASGAVLFALDAEAASFLGKALMAVSFRKEYLALVRGRMEGRGIVDHAIPRSPEAPERIDAQTEVAALATSPVERCTLVWARPITGRLHQIRRHLKHLSHPILGDVRYGDGKMNRQVKASCGLARMALHAHRLRFPHPLGHTVDVECPIPEDLQAVLARIELDSTSTVVSEMPPAEPATEIPRALR